MQRGCQGDPRDSNTKGSERDGLYRVGTETRETGGGSREHSRRNWPTLRSAAGTWAGEDGKAALDLAKQTLMGNQKAWSQGRVKGRAGIPSGEPCAG